MGYPGEVLDSFIAGLGMPRSLGAFKVGPESFARLAERAMDTPWVPRNPRSDRRPRAGSRDPRTGRLNERTRRTRRELQWAGRRSLAARMVDLRASEQTEVDGIKRLVYAVRYMRRTALGIGWNSDWRLF